MCVHWPLCRAADTVPGRAPGAVPAVPPGAGRPPVGGLPVGGLPVGGRPPGAGRLPGAGRVPGTGGAGLDRELVELANETAACRTVDEASVTDDP